MRVNVTEPQYSRFRAVQPSTHETRLILMHQEFPSLETKRAGCERVNADRQCPGDGVSMYGTAAVTSQIDRAIRILSRNGNARLKWI